ncbi:MAG: hypothetical protein L0Y39_12935 [Methylococcaceae bacterium]|nr:hypothetical protein [Methylococcaceae bacterium]
MRSTDEAIEQFCSYFEREIGEISRVALTNGDGAAEPSAANGPLYRKVLFVTMLDTLAGVRFNKKAFPEFAKQNRARFSRFVIEHCSWPEAEFVIYGLPRYARAFSHLKTRNRLQQYIRPVGAHLALAPMTFARQVPIS